MPSWIRLTVLLSALTVHCFLDGTCPRRDPPPRVLVVSPGSVLVLACSGQVEVNGLEVTVNRAKHTSTIARNGKYTSVITGVHPSTVSTTTNTTSNGTTVSTTTDTTSNGTTVSTTTDTTSNGTFVSTTTDTTSNGTTVSTTTDTTSNGTTVSTTTDTASNGTTVSTTTDTTSNGTTVSAIKDGSDNGTTVSTIKDGSDNGTTVSTIKDGSDNGTTVSAIKDDSDNGTTVSAIKDDSDNGTTVSTIKDGSDNGTTVSTIKDGSDNGTTVSAIKDDSDNGTTVSAIKDDSDNGTTVSTIKDGSDNGTTVSTIKDDSDNGTTVSTIKDGSDNGTTVSAIKDDSDNGTTVSAIKDGSDNGTTVSAIKDDSDNGTTVSAIKDGSDNGTTVSAIKDGSDNGTTVSAIKDGSDNGTTVSTIKDGSDNGIDTFSTGKDTIVLTVTDTPVTDDTGTDSREKTVIRNTRAGNHTLTVREVNKGNGENEEDETEEEHKGGGEQRDTGRSLFTVNQSGHTDTQKLFPLTGTSLQPTRDSGVGGADTELSSNRWTDAMDSEHDYEEEEEGGRMVRGLRGRSQWRLNGRPLRGGEERGGVVVLGRRGATLTLPSLAVGDSGNYSCHRGGKLVSCLRVSVAVPPERPKLSCYKRSPSSKIRCDWTASQPVTPVPQCYLLLRKGLSGSFSRVNCSYSALLSRCWCAIGHQEKESREPHLAYLCVTNTAGNTTSPLLDFTPLDIINPDPPSSVVVRGVEGQERRLRVGWAVPHSWKERDRYHELLYELRYHTMPHGTQIKGTTTARFYTITDALPGVQYLIQLRAKEEFDGHWSEWSTAVYANTWTAPVPTAFSDLSTVMDYTDDTDSGSGMTEETSVSESRGDVEVWPHVLWVVASCVLLSITLLSTYLYRHRERFLSKLWRLSPVSSSPACPSPPVTALPTQEGHALVNFDHPIYGEPVPQEEERKEEDEEEEEEEKGEVIRFNNTSYFLVQSK
ncbi:interleukin-6 receptor subunit alpha isoform X2 [Oncorhynchus mykiss]|uniref:interleukin-6 receptor subunit alpha isoform X2 n=1 Tax=Oncorhynchus mykiss TaxID=8022 RepID=UPI0018776F13|nr:interleukin-6 receptor subunit alpha isoform X2 [Oncorhynchus mykiss]